MIKEVAAKVTLVQAPGHSLVGLAAKFCTNAGTYEEILAQYSQEELNAVGLNAIGMGHLAVSEFDDYVFAIEGVSRTCTHQLVRKRIGVAYGQESMRYCSQKGEYRIVVPESLRGKEVRVNITLSDIWDVTDVYADLSLEDLADIANQFYEGLQVQGVPNEDARFGLLECSKTKILMKINVHALFDWFKVRTCTCAQWEIRAVANQMLQLCKTANPDMFANAGPTCLEYGMCKEGRKRHAGCNRMPHIEQVVAGETAPFKSI